MFDSRQALASDTDVAYHIRRQRTLGVRAAVGIEEIDTEQMENAKRATGFTGQLPGNPDECAIRSQLVYNVVGTQIESWNLRQRACSSTRVDDRLRVCIDRDSGDALGEHATACV